MNQTTPIHSCHRCRHDSRASVIASNGPNHQALAVTGEIKTRPPIRQAVSPAARRASAYSGRVDQRAADADPRVRQRRAGAAREIHTAPALPTAIFDPSGRPHQNPPHLNPPRSPAALLPASHSHHHSTQAPSPPSLSACRPTHCLLSSPSACLPFSFH